jgi:anti-sigma factor ChrR (cupin superfamily)
MLRKQPSVQLTAVHERTDLGIIRWLLPGREPR